MKNAKLKPILALVQDDPTLRMDILAKRLLEQIMTHCTDPALIFVYARFKPGIEEAIEECLAPMKPARRKRAR